jgi:hypothetical protein
MSMPFARTKLPLFAVMMCPPLAVETLTANVEAVGGAAHRVFT